MYKNILVAVALDHSPQAEAALRVARTLSDAGAKITALHVIEDIPMYAASQVPADLLASRKPEAEKELKEAVGADSGISPVVVYGHPGQTIVNFADDKDIDSIIIASHKPALQDVFLGSTAQRVVRHARCPVHVLR